MASFFENSLSKRSADLKSQHSEFFMSPASLAAFGLFVINDLQERLKKKEQKVLSCFVLPSYSTANKESSGDNRQCWILTHTVNVHFKSPSTLTPTGVL